MRLLKLGIYYSIYLQDFYATRPQLAMQSYSVQHRELIEDCFGSSDFWTQALTKLGYQTTDIIANAEALQKSWARENGLKFDENNWIFEIAAAQIKKFRPEALFVADYSTFTAAFLKSVRRDNPSLRVILGWCGAPYNDESVFAEWDIALSCIPEMVTDFKNKGHRSFHVNHAFAPRVLAKLDSTSVPSIDFAFNGSVFKQNRFHLERERILLHLVNRTNLQIWSDIRRPAPEQKHKAFIRQKMRQAVGAADKAGVPQRLLSALPFAQRDLAVSTEYIDERIARRARRAVFGIDMFQRLRDSRIVLNTHIDASPNSASNMRLFEATGVGTCLLTDYKENLAELFEPDIEVLTYRSAEECVEKVEYILGHEQERLAIAAAGQQRTLRQHNFDDRARRIDEIIKNFCRPHGQKRASAAD